jgi:hypothetical protein
MADPVFVINLIKYGNQNLKTQVINLLVNIEKIREMKDRLWDLTPSPSALLTAASP